MTLFKLAIESGPRTDLPNAWKVKKGMGPNGNIPIAKGLFKQAREKFFTKFTNEKMSHYSNEDRKYLAKKMRKGYEIGGAASALGVGGLSYALTKKEGLSAKLGIGALIPGAIAGSAFMLAKHLKKVKEKNKLEKVAIEIPVSHLKGDGKEINEIRSLAKRIIKITRDMNKEDAKAMK